ncbi:M56 family metallopeptidase [Streptacidiphilus sp. PAMC 29251]
MTLTVWAPLALPLLLAPLLSLPSIRSLPDRLPPRAAVWLLTSTCVGLAGAGTVALGLLSLAALLQLPVVAALGQLELPVARHLAPPAVGPVGAVAGLLLVAAALRTVQVLAHHRRQYLEARVLVAVHGAGGDLVVVPDTRPDAYALPAGLRRGSPGRIVVTAGMLRALAKDERDVLLAHERAHLSGHHHRFVLLADLAIALHPLLRPLRDGVAYSVERWADEAAADRLGDRRLVAQAVGRAAMATLAHRREATAGAGATLGMAAGPVPRRVAALLNDSPAASARGDLRRPVVAATVLASVLLLSSATAWDAATDLHQQVEAGQQYSLIHERSEDRSAAVPGERSSNSASFTGQLLEHAASMGRWWSLS